jgi:hypothetical protein
MGPLASTIHLDSSFSGLASQLRLAMLPYRQETDALPWRPRGEAHVGYVVYCNIRLDKLEMVMEFQPQGCRFSSAKTSFRMDWRIVSPMFHHKLYACLCTDRVMGNAAMREPKEGFSSPALARLFDGLNDNLVQKSDGVRQRSQTHCILLIFSTLWLCFWFWGQAD